MKLHSMTIFIRFSDQMNIYGIEPNKNTKPNLRLTEYKLFLLVRHFMVNVIKVFSDKSRQ